MKLFLILASCFFVKPSFAAKGAIIVTEGAIVYRKPSFDAPILGYFSAGKRVRVSSKTHGPFYRVRFKQGAIGYISDIDVKVKGQKSFQSAFDNKKTRKINRKGRPYLGRTYAGLHMGSVSFADTVGNFSKASDTIMLGAAFSTPLSYFDGAFNFSSSFLYSLETPVLYKSISQIEPEGFVVVGDMQLLYPLTSMLSRKLSVYLGAGMAVSYTDVTVVQDVNGDTTRVPISSISIGGSFSLGLAYQISNVVLKFEPKYYLEEDAYLGLTSSIMFGF